MGSGGGTTVQYCPLLRQGAALVVAADKVVVVVVVDVPTAPTALLLVLVVVVSVVLPHLPPVGNVPFIGKLPAGMVQAG